MLNENLRKRLNKDRPMTTVTLRMPVDVVASLKEIAPLKGLRGYQTLLKSYVSEGLRRDELQYLGSDLERLVASLKAQGVAEKVIEQAVKEAVECR